MRWKSISIKKFNCVKPGINWPHDNSSWTYSETHSLTTAAPEEHSEERPQLSENIFRPHQVVNFYPSWFLTGPVISGLMLAVFTIFRYVPSFKFLLINNDSITWSSKVPAHIFHIYPYQSSCIWQVTLLHLHDLKRSPLAFKSFYKYHAFCVKHLRTIHTMHRNILLPVDISTSISLFFM